MLRERQKRFSDAVLRGDFEHAVTECAGDADRIRLGLRVHANNAAHAMISATRAAYPKTARLLGDEVFTAVALHAARHAAIQGTVIGESLAPFPAFLVTLDGIDRRAAPCAHFEALWLEAFHAADAEPLPPARLAALDGESFAAMRVVFHPSLRLYRPDGTVGDGDETDWGFLFKPHALLRPALAVETFPLAWSSVITIDALTSGRSIGEALDAATDTERALSDLGRLIHAGAIVQLH